MEAIIKSLLDNDLYKFTMQYAVVKLFPNAKVRYTFILRSKVGFPEGFANELRQQISFMEGLRLTPEEKKFFSEKSYYIDPTYFDFLSGYKYDAWEVGVIQQGEELQINIEGYWYRTILWEVPILALVSAGSSSAIDTRSIEPSFTPHHEPVPPFQVPSSASLVALM